MSLFFRDLAENNTYMKRLIHQIQNRYPKVNEREILAFFRLMKEKGILMAGGSILHVLTKQPGYANDFDMYSPLESVKPMVAFLEKEFQANRYPDRYASVYSMSFLRKNGINKVISFSNTSHIIPRYYLISEIDHFPRPVIDLMQLKKGVRPIDVVSNFDLTFCQCWFDGEKFYATHPEDIRKKEGSLNQDYRATFLAGNMFLKNRFEKYNKKGFTISIPSEKPTNRKFLETPIVKGQDFYTKWFFRGALRYALNAYPFFSDDFYLRKDPQTGREIALITADFVGAWRTLDRSSMEFREAKKAFHAARDRIAGITKSLDGIDDEEISSFEQLVSILGGGISKAQKGIGDFARFVANNNEEWEQPNSYIPYIETARRIVEESERYRRTQLRSFTGSQFARSLPEAGIQRRIMEMANVPSLRQQAVAMNLEMPALLENAAIQAALAQPPLRPQRGLLQAPNFGNRQGGSAKRKTRGKAKARRSTRKH